MVIVNQAVIFGRVSENLSLLIEELTINGQLFLDLLNWPKYFVRTAVIGGQRSRDFVDTKR